MHAMPVQLAVSIRYDSWSADPPKSNTVPQVTIVQVPRAAGHTRALGFEGPSGAPLALARVQSEEQNPAEDEEQPRIDLATAAF